MAVVAGNEASAIRGVAAERAESLKALASGFLLGGEVGRVEEIVTGHINATFRVTVGKADGSEERFVLQRVNPAVFGDPEAVMRNVERVMRHLAGKGGEESRALRLVRTRDGGGWVREEDGGLWRCFNFVEGCVTYDVVEEPKIAEEAARAFGRFQARLSNLAADELVETIPGFHDTPARHARLMAAVKADPLGRVKDVRRELEFFAAREGELRRIVEAMASGEVPRRIAHHDTKINNVLMDAATGEAVCVIDLDTVMPGSVLFDFGDLVRTAVSPAAEDEKDLSKVKVRMPVFEAIARGYLSEAAGFLTATERGLLVFSARLITLELAMRFLTDHLEGDGYFRIERPGQNLDRCRAQLALVERMEERAEAMERVVQTSV